MFPLQMSNFNKSIISAFLSWQFRIAQPQPSQFSPKSKPQPTLAIIKIKFLLAYSHVKHVQYHL